MDVVGLGWGGCACGYSCRETISPYVYLRRGQESSLTRGGVAWHQCSASGRVGAAMQAGLCAALQAYVIPQILLFNVFSAER
jgi:hypothetical protein